MVKKSLLRDAATYKWRQASRPNMSGVGSSSRWAYDDEVEQWAEEEVARELAEMTGPLEQLEELEEEEEWGSPDPRAGSEVDCSELFAQVSAARAVFLEGARSFLDFSVQEVQSAEKGTCCDILCKPFVLHYVERYCCSSQHVGEGRGGLQHADRGGAQGTRRGGWAGHAGVQMSVCYSSTPAHAHKMAELLRRELATPTESQSTDRDLPPTQPSPAGMPAATPTAALPTATPTADLLIQVSPAARTPSPVLCQEEEERLHAEVQQQWVSGG